MRDERQRVPGMKPAGQDSGGSMHFTSGPGSPPRWAAALDVPAFLALREGRAPLVLVAPHGGRRKRAIRPGDSVNDLHTAAIAWELAERTNAHAIVNHGLDRNDIDLNRIAHLCERAPEVLALLSAAIEDAAAGGMTPLVLFIHGWNMVVPCCDIGIGLRRRGEVLTGRHPTLSRSRYDATIAAIESELSARGITTAVGRRYTASGRDNAAQLFSGRHAAHDDAAVAALGRLAAGGRVDAAQLELGIPLRWDGRYRCDLVDGLTAALSIEQQSPSRRNAVEPCEHVTARSDWDLPATAAGEPGYAAAEPGYSLQAVLDPAGSVATFCGVEATGPQSMAVRFSVVSTDGSMMLLVGEGYWDGQYGRYELEGFSWTAGDNGRSIEIRLRAPMIRYTTHDAYVDLEYGLASSQVVDADVALQFDATGAGHGQLRGHVRAGDVELSIDAVAFADRGGRRGAEPRGRIRVVAARGAHDVVAARSEDSEGCMSLELVSEAGPLGAIRPAAGRDVEGLEEAIVLARVPVWRPLIDGTFSRWTFGIVRCRFTDGSECAGLFDSLEVFRRRIDT